MDQRLFEAGLWVSAALAEVAVENDGNRVAHGATRAQRSHYQASDFVNG
jgi:hypothetical protein